MKPSGIQLNRLTTLAREIRSQYASVEGLISNAKRACNEAVGEAILLGTKLTEAKQIVGHGNWLIWLAEHCPEISERTARNYITLSNRQHISDLENSKSLRQAYLKIGIISEPEQSALPHSF
jgi:hypothetical protein